MGGGAYTKKNKCVGGGELWWNGVNRAVRWISMGGGRPGFFPVRPPENFKWNSPYY